MTRRAPLRISQGGEDDTAACSPSPEALLAAMSEHDDTRDVFIDAEALADDVAAPDEGAEQPRDDDDTTRDAKNTAATSVPILPVDIDEDEDEDPVVDAETERGLLCASRESSLRLSRAFDDEPRFSGPEDLDDSDEDSDDDDDDDGDDGDVPRRASATGSHGAGDASDIGLVGDIGREERDERDKREEDDDRLDAGGVFRSVGVGASVSDVFDDDDENLWLAYSPDRDERVRGHRLAVGDDEGLGPDFEGLAPEWAGPTSPLADPNRRARPRRRGVRDGRRDVPIGDGRRWGARSTSSDGGGDGFFFDDDEEEEEAPRRDRRRRARTRALRFTGEALAGVQVQVEVANVEVDERACGEDSDEEAGAVVAAVRRWQDPWRRHRDANAPARGTYSTTAAHPLHPVVGVADPAAFDGARDVCADPAAAAMRRMMWRRDDAVGSLIDDDEDDGPEQPEPVPVRVDADIRDAARAIEEARRVLDRELASSADYDDAMDDAIDAAFARAEETLDRTEETAAALSPGGGVEPGSAGRGTDGPTSISAQGRPGKDKEGKDKEGKDDEGKDDEGGDDDDDVKGGEEEEEEGDLGRAISRRAGVDVSTDSAFDGGGAGGAGSAAVFRSRSLESSPPAAPASDLSSASASSASAAAAGGASGGANVATLARRSSSKKRIEMPPASVAGHDRPSRLHSPAAKSRPTSREARFGSPVFSGERGGAHLGTHPGASGSTAASAFASAFGLGGYGFDPSDPVAPQNGGTCQRGVADLVMSRESRLVGALRGEIRRAREDRMELEARCQGLQLRSSAAEWERDGLRSRVEELERSLEQHRRALRREVTTRVKVGLDYGDFRGGRHVRSDERDVGSEHAHHRAPLFPQEVLQAVVRGAVDQSVECALGTSHGGPAGHGAALVDRGSGGGGDERRGDERRGFSGLRAIEDLQASSLRAIEDDADSGQTLPAVSQPYPAPFVPASDLDLDDAVHVPDAGVLEDASHLYSMVRDALRVQT